MDLVTGSAEAVCVGGSLDSRVCRKSASFRAERMPPAEWAPVCLIEPPHACWQAGRHMRCPSSTHGSCHGCGISSTGAWRPTSSHTYYLDLGLAEALANVLHGSRVVEFGAGHGCYTSFLRGLGLRVSAYDGIEGVGGLTHGLVTTADLTLRLSLPSADWVLAMEVAEHVPRMHEKQLLANIHRHNREGVVLSWANSAIGHGHYNPRSNAYVVHQLAQMGYAHDVRMQDVLRANVSTFPWFRHTLMAFRRTPLARQVKLGKLWPTWEWERTWRMGYCSPVAAGKKASCDTDVAGTWKVQDGLNATGMRRCAKRCQACGRCRFVSYSARFSDCDWFTECNLDRLTTTEPGSSPASGRKVLDHVTLQVKK